MKKKHNSCFFNIGTVNMHIFTLTGAKTERVQHYEYLGIWLDENVSYRTHVENLSKKLKTKPGFFYRNKGCFTTEGRKQLVQSTFMSVLDSDIMYMHAAHTTLTTLDALYQCHSFHYLW